MAKVIYKCGIQRKEGYLYFIGKNGYVYEVKMARGRKRGGTRKQVGNYRITREKGYLYFLDRQGNVCAAKMQRGGKRRKKR